VENYILEKECKVREIDYNHSCVTLIVVVEISLQLHQALEKEI
jgi:hypothetical protein